MEPQQARMAFAGFLTLCALIIFNALFLQKDAGFAVGAVPGSQVSWSANEAAQGEQRGAPGQRETRAVNFEENKRIGLLRALRRELSAQNYFPGRPVSGTVDAMTMGAIMAFEYDHELPVTGKPSNELLKNILFRGAGGEGRSEKPSYKRAHPSRLIAEIQGTLSALGLYEGKIDGVLREAAQQAVRRFESERSLPVSGRVSGLLVQELMRATGVEFSALQ